MRVLWPYIGYGLVSVDCSSFERFFSRSIFWSRPPAPLNRYLYPSGLCRIDTGVFLMLGRYMGLLGLIALVLRYPNRNTIFQPFS